MNKLTSIQFPIEIDSLGIGVSDEIATRVAALNETHSSLLEQLTLIAEKQKITSKLIGEYKRESRDIEPLKNTMKILSGQKKSLEESLKQLQHSDHQVLALISANTEAKKNDLNTACEPDLFTPVTTAQNQEYNEPYSVREVDTVSDIELWQAYVNSNRRCSAYHQYDLRHVIEQTMGHRCIYLIAFNDNKQPVGILPAIHLKSKLFGSLLVSQPFFNYGGAIGDSDVIENSLIQALIEKAKSLDIEMLDLRDTRKRTALPSRDHKASMLLALPKKEATLWDDIGAKVRAQVKKARSYNPTIRFGGKELLRDFYYVFSRNMRDLGTPVYSIDFFEQLLAADAIDATVVVSYFDNRPVSCAILVAHGNTLEIPWASTLRSANRYNANMFLYWNILAYSINNGYQHFDFGRSSKDASTYKFKKQWGAQPHQLHWHYWQANDMPLPEVSPNNPKYKLLIYFWKKLPIMLSNFLGPKIVKYIP